MTKRYFAEQKEINDHIYHPFVYDPDAGHKAEYPGMLLEVIDRVKKPANLESAEFLLGLTMILHYVVETH